MATCIRALDLAIIFLVNEGACRVHYRACSLSRRVGFRSMGVILFSLLWAAQLTSEHSRSLKSLGMGFVPRSARSSNFRGEFCFCNPRGIEIIH